MTEVRPAIPLQPAIPGAPAPDALDRDSAVPLYAQLEDILRAQIAAGQWQANQRVPSENELNKMYGVSRMTARGVLTTLVNDALLFRVPGKGTFVARPKISTFSPAYRGVREQLETMGYETRTELLGVAIEDVPDAVRRGLGFGLEEQQAIYAIHRVRSIQGEPISLHHSYVPAARAPGLDTVDVVDEQLCVVLESRYGLRMRKVTEGLEAVAVSAVDAKHLKVPAGSAVLRLEDCIADENDLPFEFSRITFRGDKIRLRFDYEL